MNFIIIINNLQLIMFNILINLDYITIILNKFYVLYLNLYLMILLIQVKV